MNTTVLWIVLVLLVLCGVYLYRVLGRKYPALLYKNWKGKRKEFSNELIEKQNRLRKAGAILHYFIYNDKSFQSLVSPALELFTKVKKDTVTLTRCAPEEFDSKYIYLDIHRNDWRNTGVHCAVILRRDRLTLTQMAIFAAAQPGSPNAAQILAGRLFVKLAKKVQLTIEPRSEGFLGPFKDLLIPSNNTKVVSGGGAEFNRLTKYVSGNIYHVTFEDPSRKTVLLDRKRQETRGYKLFYPN